MIEFYPKSIYYPREAVEKKYAAGELQFAEKQLFDFVQRHSEDIVALAREDESEPSDETLLDNLRACILSIGSLNPAADLGDALQELSKEIWYQNEKQTISASEVTEQWKEMYSVKLQEARLFEAFILIEYNARALLEILRGSESKE